MTETHSIDRRAARTRAALRSSFAGLLRERPYESITVAGICNRAGVGRSTFYGHYRDKDDLKTDAMQGVCHALTRAHAAAPHGERPFGFGVALFDHAREHNHLCRASLNGAGGDIALDAIGTQIAALVKRDVAATTAVERDAIAQIVAAAYVAGVRWWLTQDNPPGPMEMDDLCRKALNQGIAVNA